jgi:lactate dehydrogenase-like 2-hydroxyacid dehydrogenase
MPLRLATLQIGVFPTAHQALIDSELRCYTEQDIRHDALLKERIRAILMRSNYTVPVSLLDELPNLKVISTSGVGYDGIPLAQAKARGIVVTNTPGVLDAAVSELALGLLLALLRQLPGADSFVRAGHWQQGIFTLGSSLAGKTVGIVGLGRIGLGIARRLEGFDVKIAYTGGNPKPVPYRFVPDILELAAESDILVLSCPGGEKTHHLINAAVLERLGPNGFLINVARGTVVDEAALVAALENKTLRGAAMDVFEKEPLADSRLMQMNNVILTPHMGSATEETRRIMLRLALDNIHHVLNNKAALTPVWRDPV